MPRKRQIDPKFWLNGEISKISDRAKLLYIGLWNFADDNGTIENNPGEIRAAIFPYNAQLKIDKYIDELIKIKKIIPYDVDGKKYFWIKNFLRHQKVDYPSFKNPLSDSIREDIASVQRGLVTNRVELSRVEKSRVENNNTKVLGKPERFGNKDINDLIELLKEKFKISVLDGSEKENRKYCWLAIKKFKKEGVEIIIEAGASDKFWQHKITGFKTLYYNGVKIASTIKGQKANVVAI